MAIQTSDIAVSYGNMVISFAQQVASLRQLGSQIAAINAVNPLGNLWNNLHTTALGTDGSLGTADSGNPVLTDPIDTRVYPALNRVAKASDLANALQLVVDFNTFAAGTALSANGARPANINAVAM